MPPLAKQAVRVTFDAADTKRTSKHLGAVVPGRMTLAQNVVQRKTGRYGKRDGFSDYVTTTDSGTISVGKDINTTASALALRTTDALYSYASAQTKWLNRGELRACVPTWNQVAAGTGRGTHAISGGYTYVFAGSTYYVYDTDGALASTGAHGVGTSLMKAVVAGGFVWAFGCNGSTLTVSKFNPASPTSSPTTTTYGTPSVGSYAHFDIMLTSADDVAVLEIGSMTLAGSAGTFFLSKMSNSTGLPAAARVFSTTISGFSVSSLGCWVQGDDGTDGTLHIAMDGAGSTVIVADVNATTLAVTGASYATGSTTTNDMCAYRAGASEIVVFHTDATGAVAENVLVRKTSTTGGASVLKRACALASIPFTVNSRWYVIVNHVDGSDLQNCYYVLDLTTGARIVARAMYEEGGGLWGSSGATIPATALGTTSWLPQVTVSGTTATLIVGRRPGGTLTYEVERLVLDFSGDMGRSSAIGGAVIQGGGWAVRQPNGEALHDIAPAMYPRTIAGAVTTFAGTVPAGTYPVAIVYAVHNIDGTITRSIEASTSIALGGPLSIRIAAPTLRFTNCAGTTMFIETYIGAAAGAATTLRYYGRTANDPTADTVNCDITSVAALGELLYNVDGSLDNTVPEVFTVSATWRDRLFYVDANNGDVLFTRPIAAGSGPQFNEDLSFSLREGTGNPRALGTVSDDYFAILKTDAIWTISGLGPDNFGRGNYEPQRLPGNLGSTNAVTLTTKQGLCFQATDGGIWLLTTGRELVYIGRAWEAYKGDTLTGAVDDAKRGLALFFMSSGVVLAWDYWHPAAAPMVAADGYGQGYVWTGQTAVAACISGGVAHYCKSTGVVAKQVIAQYFDGTSTPILPKLTVAPLAAAGLQGLQHVYRGQLLGETAGNATLAVTVTHSYGTAATAVSIAVTASALGVEFRPAQTRDTALEVTIEETGSGVTEGFALEALALEVGIKPGLRHLATTSRI